MIRSCRENIRRFHFGFRHDGPLYAVGNISDDKLQILQMFADYCLTDEAQALATEYVLMVWMIISVNKEMYQEMIFSMPRNSGKKRRITVSPGHCRIVADVSGSMDGEPINMLRQSLINGMKYIGKDNYVGLVSYSDGRHSQCTCWKI